MRKDHLDTLFLKHSDPPDGLLSLLTIDMYAANVTFSICPLSNHLLTSEKPPIMACITAKVDVVIF